MRFVMVRRTRIARGSLMRPAGLLLLIVPLCVEARQDPKDWPPPLTPEQRARPPGLLGTVGPRGEPRTAESLEIRERGTYEGYLVDRGWAEGDAVRIRADGVVLRNCEIRNGRADAVEVYASDVLIESCRIHHFLKGTFRDQADAHGITGRPTRLTIRNCEIYGVSGDSAQFDPGRGPWTDVLIENCEFWTGPLPEDAAGFRKGEQPGENALDTKQRASNPRSRIVVRNSVFHGFRKGGQIDNMAALNLKNHVEATVENCVFYDNEIALRLRGGRGPYGGARVTVRDSFFYTAEVAVRHEDGIEGLRVLNPAFGQGVGRRFREVAGAARDLEISGEREAPDLPTLLGK